MNKLLAFAAASEAATGAALMIVPSLVGQLLFGVELIGIAIPLARIAGIALISLVLACWPGSDTAGSPSRALRAMFCYSLLASLYLTYLGISGVAVGILLWPAVVVHAVLTLLFVRGWIKRSP